MIQGRKVYDPLTNTWSTGYWVRDDYGNWYPVWAELRRSRKGDYTMSNDLRMTFLILKKRRMRND